MPSTSRATEPLAVAPSAQPERAPNHSSPNAIYTLSPGAHQLITNSSSTKVGPVPAISTIVVY